MGDMRRCRLRTSLVFFFSERVSSKGLLHINGRCINRLWAERPELLHERLLWLRNPSRAAHQLHGLVDRFAMRLYEVRCGYSARA